MRLEITAGIIKERLDAESLVRLWNEYADSASCFDSRILRNNEEGLNELFDGCDSSEVVRAVRFGRWKSSDEWIRLNGYGNLESTRDTGLDEWVDYDSLERYANSGDCSMTDNELYFDDEDDDE